jgi:ABC-type uncharacterized transport system substrate-binding protein
MRLRRVAMLAMAMVLAASASAAAPGLHRIVHVCDCPASMSGEERTGLLLEFARLGYVQGRNLDLISHDYSTTKDTYASLLEQEIAQAKTDLILASGIRVAQAARQLKGAPPVVFWRLTDPVGFGLVSNIARPGGNLTGFSRAIEKLTVKRLELLHEMLPRARRIGFAFISDNSAHQRQAAEILDAAPSLGLEAKAYTLPSSQWTPAELETLFSKMKQERVEAFLLPDQNAGIRTLIMLAEKYRLPTLYSLTEIVTEWGGLAAYATESNGRPADIVNYAHLIFKGKKPGDLPVQEPTRFELIVNARAARDIGVVFPPRFLLRASQVIER